MSETSPFFTLLTGTRNRCELLRAAIESVLAQGFPDFEHIVVDAMSTDDTPAMLAGYPHVRVIREPDRGFFDGLNKAMRIARGEFIGLLNSDDLYPPGVFQRAAAAAGDFDVVSGGAHIFREDGSIQRNILEPAEIALNLRNVLGGEPLINSRFFRRSFCERVGEFDIAYPIAEDREWLFRAALLPFRETVIPELFYRYRHHAGSLTFDDTQRSVLAYREEHATFAEQHLARADLPAAVRPELRRYHTRESVSVATMHWKAGRRDRVREWARRGCAQTALWPLAFARRLVGQALGR